MAARTIPAEWRLTGSDPIKLAAAPPAEIGSDVTGPRRFDGIAYSGGLVNIGWYGRSVFELSGIEIDSQRKPALRQHDHERIAGFTDAITCNGKLVVSGVLTGRTEAGLEVANLSDEGFPWQMSVGLGIPEAGEVHEVMEGHTCEVNGQTFEGPLLVFRKSRLKEVSFVPCGADPATSAVALADGSTPQITLPARRPSMPADIDPVAAERERVKTIRAAFPEDAQFALEQIETGASLADAQKVHAYIARERTKTAELQQKLADAEAKAAALVKAPRGAKPLPTGGAGAGSAGGGDESAAQRWNREVRAEQTKGVRREAAIATVNRRDPDLHLSMLREANPNLEIEYDRKAQRLAY